MNENAVKLHHVLPIRLLIGIFLVRLLITGGFGYFGFWALDGLATGKPDPDATIDVMTGKIIMGVMFGMIGAAFSWAITPNSMDARYLRRN